MVRNQINVAYLDQKKRAIHRGITWCFTYEQWVAWWKAELGPSWFKLRGIHRYEYCMARKGDKGPYAAWNVECVSNAKNGRDRKPFKGSANGNSKLTEQQVLEIRKTPGSFASLGRKYGVRYQTIQGIKYGRLWRHI